MDDKKARYNFRILPWFERHRCRWWYDRVGREAVGTWYGRRGGRVAGADAVPIRARISCKLDLGRDQPQVEHATKKGSCPLCPPFFSLFFSTQVITCSLVANQKMQITKSSSSSVIQPPHDNTARVWGAVFHVYVYWVCVCFTKKGTISFCNLLCSLSNIFPCY